MKTRKIEFKGGPVDGVIWEMPFPFPLTYDYPIDAPINMISIGDSDVSKSVSFSRAHYELKAVRDIETDQIVDEFYQFTEAPDWYFMEEINEGKNNVKTSLV